MLQKSFGKVTKKIVDYSPHQNDSKHWGRGEFSRFPNYNFQYVQLSTRTIKKITKCTKKHTLKMKKNDYGLRDL